MKIVQLLPELNEGGIERGVVELSRELVKRGHESIVISNGGKLVQQLEQEGGRHVQCDICTKNPFTVYFRTRKLRKILKNLSPDIIHARSRLPAWMTCFANKSLHLPFVTTVHGLNSVSKYSEIMTKGERVITVSEVVRDYIAKHYDVNLAKVTVIQRGVDTNRFDPRVVDHEFIKDFKQRHDLADKFILSSVGRITWLKDYETFIRSIARVSEQIPNIVGLIAGGVREDKQDYYEGLVDLARAEGVEDRIRFVGSQTNIREVYFLSDVIVNASLKMGNVARTITEALAMDVPVIATTFEGLNNIIVDGRNGYIIRTQDVEDLAEKIILIRENPIHKVRETLSPEFTLQQLVESTVEVYHSLVSRQ
jgi:glycosyltransferase involved in cell wall biosynthesis